MSNKVHKKSMQPRNHSSKHRSSRSSPSLPMWNGTNQYIDNSSYRETPVSTTLSLVSSSIRCFAYYIYRLDLDNYAEYTIKQAVDSVVSGPRSRGLKVKLSLLDEGLVIDNMLDPNQSWMYKTSELLYFWHDPNRINIVVIVTLNRSSYRAPKLYSASIFRLRGHESVQLFLQQAPEYFSQLPIQDNSRSNSRMSIDKSASVQSWIADDNRNTRKKKSKHRSTANEQRVTKSSRSLQPTSAQPITRAEFDPRRTSKKSRSRFNKHRTYSDTTLSSDTQTSSSKKQPSNYDEDDKTTTASNNLSGGNVADLMRELKELRHEIASLKLEARFTPLRSVSTSPLPLPLAKKKGKMGSLQHIEITTETQTDLSLMGRKGQKLSAKNKSTKDLSNGVSATNKKKTEQLNTTVNKPTFSSSSNNTASDQEDTLLINSSGTNGSSDGLSLNSEKHYQPTLPSTKSRAAPNIRPNSSTQANGPTSNNTQPISNSNSTKTNSSLPITPAVSKKETSKVPKDTEFSLPRKSSEVVSFHSSLENTITLPDHVYENMPVLYKMVSSPILRANTPVVEKSNQEDEKPAVHVTISGDYTSEMQQQYLSHLFGQQNGLAAFLPPNSSYSLPKQNTTPDVQQPNDQALFANRLTNPLFTMDKQLLTNTIANQFGVDLKSPYLQQLIANQHLFATQKRTFANMIWQITPEEEYDLCTTPVVTTPSNIMDSNNSTAKSILKAKKPTHLIPKPRRISWNNGFL